MDFDESIRYMNGLLRFGWKLGNEQFEALCERLGNPQDRYRVVHITGTKGKGSTTALTAGLLKAAGYRVGAYFSPYVYDPCERVQLNGGLIPRDAFARLATKIRPHIEALAQTELGQTTEFEMKTALGFCYFAEQQVDYACIEVGIGGRLDATNIVRPNVCVITNIGLDHVQQLGDTHALIAGEKAGIIKQGIPCITATDHPEALEVIRRTAEERGSALAHVTRGPVDTPTADPACIHWNVSADAKSSLEPSPPSSSSSSLPSSLPSSLWESQHSEQTASLSIAMAHRLYSGLPVKLAGLYQRVNAACAVAAVETALQRRGMQLAQEVAALGLAQTTLPGRMETVQVPGGPLIVLDGAHNEMAAAALRGPIQALMQSHRIERLLLVVGMLTGHEPQGVLGNLVPLSARVFVCQPEWKRALDAETLAGVARSLHSDVTLIPSVPDAVRAAIAAAGPLDMVLVSGSFYTVGEAPVARWVDSGAL